MERKRVAVIGKGPLAIETAEWFHNRQASYDLVAIVPVLPEPDWMPKFKEDWGDYAKHWGRLEVLERHEDLEGHFDVLFSVFYHRLLPKELLDRIDLPLNLHPGPLPRYRGVRPLNWALKNGEDHHGVTIHRMDEGVDSGPILSQVLFPLFPDDYLRTAYERMNAYAQLLLKHTLPNIHSIEPRRQDESMALTYRHKDDSKLGEWSSW